MKLYRLLILLLLVLPGFRALSQSYFLLPEQFHIPKGDKLNIHLLATDDFTKQAGAKFEADKTTKFVLNQGKQKIDLNKLAADSVLSCTIPESGLALIDMTRASSSNEMSRNKFLRYLSDDEQGDLTDKVKNSNQLYFKEKFTNYAETMVAYDKTSGKLFEKGLGNTYEIVLQQNPYKMNYGDDVNAIIMFKGKPLANATVFLYVKTVGGNVFPQKLTSDATGIIYFKVSREGVYLLRSKHIEASTDKTADFESWRTTFTFAFSSNDDLPNTYKEFGFGDRH
jgi:hypothetical protein